MTAAMKGNAMRAVPLEPCPFCGHAAQLYEGESDPEFNGSVTCGSPIEVECHAACLFVTAKQWNRRAAAPAPVDGLVERWDASSDSHQNDSGVWSAGIDDSSVWGHRIQVHADTIEEAEALRDQVLAALQSRDEGEPVCIGEIIEIPDDLGTKFVAWNEERYKLPVGTKIYATPPRKP